MNKFSRMIDVLDLFSEEDSLLTAEDIAARLQLSRTTAFRYVKELNAVGFLANYSGRYSLGARIITLDYRIRQSDPVLGAARPIMKQLTAETGCSAILCRMYNDEVINVYDEPGYIDPNLNVSSRGIPLPLFRGSASKVMLANLPARRLKRIYDNHRDDDDVRAQGPEWAAFKAYYARIRQTGHYISHHELDPHTVGIGAPIIVPSLGAVGVISLVFSSDRLAMLNTDGLASRVKELSAQVGCGLGILGEKAGLP